MKTRIGRVGVLLICAVAFLQGRASAAGKPNIIVIVADDMGYADLGCQNQSKDVRTPNIDSIATNGVRFTNGYVTCPVCSPTRAGLLTGRYQQRFGHELNPPPPPATGTGLPLDQITLPQILKANGYATGMIGKWHLGMMPKYHPMDRGFDEYFGFLHGQHIYVDADSDHRDPILRGREIVEEKTYLTEAFAREAVSFIDRHHNAPFFLYLPYNAIHVPLQAPQKYLDAFKDVGDEKRRKLLGMLSALDDAVGRVLESVRKNGIEQNTLIFFISDNGGYKINGSLNDPFRGQKTDLLEGGIREPFLVQWKDHIPAGKVLAQPVISLDIFATSLALAGAEGPKDRPMDGVNLLPLLEGKTADALHEALYWRFGAQWAVRKGNYKLLRVRQGDPKLYDLSTDPHEDHDLSQEKPEVAKDLRGTFDRWNAQLIPPLWGGGNARGNATQSTKPSED